MTTLQTTPETKRAIAFFERQLDVIEADQYPANYTAASTTWRQRQREQATYVQMAIEALSAQ